MQPRRIPARAAALIFPRSALIKVETSPYMPNAAIAGHKREREVVRHAGYDARELGQQGKIPVAEVVVADALRPSATSPPAFRAPNSHVLFRNIKSIGCSVWLIEGSWNR